MPLIDDRDSRIALEAETQRLHIRVELPATVTIDKTECRLLNLSLGGFRIAHAKAEQLKDKGRQDIVIAFDFNAFSFTIQAQAEPCHGQKNELAYRFVSLSGQQASLIRHVVRSYLSGQIFTVNDMLHVAGRDAATQKRPVANQNQKPWRRFFATALPMLAIVIALGAMAWLIGSNIYDSQKYVRSYSSSVEADVLTLRAKSNGTFVTVLAADQKHVTKDQVIGRFEDENGAIKDVLSPCDCHLAEHTARDGEFKLMGEALYRFLPKDANIYVTALLKSDQIKHLRAGNKAEIRLSGETRYREGKLIQFLPQPSEFVKVKIRPDKPLKASDLGKPAFVEISRF